MQKNLEKTYPLSLKNVADESFGTVQNVKYKKLLSAWWLFLFQPDNFFCKRSLEYV
jgi:hypothetical protein